MHFITRSHAMSKDQILDSQDSASEYSYEDENAAHTNEYLWPSVESLLQALPSKTVFDLGCGNGAFAKRIASLGFQVTGVDPSTAGIANANRSLKSVGLDIKLFEGSAYDPLSETYGKFPCLVSLEVVEHVYYPRKFARCVFDLLEPNGIAIISTPFHSYLKNLALALSGKMDSHFTALWDHGHIKFWSVKTLSTLFAEQGMILEDVKRVGRFPLLAKSMILIFRKK